MNTQKEITAAEIAEIFVQGKDQKIGNIKIVTFSGHMPELHINNRKVIERYSTLKRLVMSKKSQNKHQELLREIMKRLPDHIVIEK